MILWLYKGKNICYNDDEKSVIINNGKSCRELTPSSSPPFWEKGEKLKRYTHAIEKVLNQLGFSQNEAKVYLAALESGLASAQDIAQKAGIKRTTAYSVLGYLVGRGVVGKTKVRGKTRFLAEPPDKLLNMTREIEARIKQTLPELEAIYNKKETKPKITFYEGRHAIQNIYDDTLRAKPQEIMEWNTDAYFQNPNVDPNYIDKRIALNIKARRIAGSGSQWDKKHKYLDAKELAETVIVPKDVFWPEIEVNIYGNKVAFMNYADNMSVIIESKAIAEAMRQAYELSWEGAKILDEGIRKDQSISHDSTSP